jgi:hypothetical protein
MDDIVKKCDKNFYAYANCLKTYGNMEFTNCRKEQKVFDECFVAASSKKQ